MHSRYYRFVALVVFLILNPKYELRSKCAVSKSKDNLQIGEGPKKIKCADMLLGTGLFSNKYCKKDKETRCAKLADG